MELGYLTKGATHGLLTLMTGGGEDQQSGLDPAADALLKTHLIRRWGGGDPSALGVWAPRDYLLSLLDRVDADGSTNGLRAEIEERPADPTGRTYLALCSSNPGDVATALPSELTAPGYQRQVVDFSAPKSDGAFIIQSGVPSQVTLDGSVVFGPFTDAAGSVVPVTHLALVTAPMGADIAVMTVWPLDAPVTADQGDSLLVSPGSLTIKVA
ncbi:hypothetical protein [Streptomyces sp. NPDC004528]|uniref:phage tail fiber protein n=1 Tax=Streptomyces sp. NPDC004528 TaxID=3154550 RepID=UPI0033AC8E1F